MQILEELLSIFDKKVNAPSLTSFMLKYPTLELLFPDIRCKSLPV